MNVCKPRLELGAVVGAVGLFKTFLSKAQGRCLIACGPLQSTAICLHAVLVLSS